MRREDTAERILDIAQGLVQTRGYNAFSYADISESLRITKASLHYHYPSKAKLGHSLISRYEDNFRKLLAAIDQHGGTAAERLRGYIGIYAAVLADHRMCLCGMLAAEFDTLPQPMQSALDHFFKFNETWLDKVLAQGRADSSLDFEGPAQEISQYIISTLEGAMMLARSHADDNRFHGAARRLLAGLGVTEH